MVRAALIVLALQTAPTGWEGRLTIGEDVNESEWTIVRVLSSDNINGRRVWVSIDHSRDQTEQYRETRTLYDIDCRRQTAAVRSHTHYMPNGRTVQGYYNGSSNPIIPDTMLDLLHTAICE